MLKYGLSLLTICFCFCLYSQLSHDKSYNDKLKTTLSRNVKDITVWDLSIEENTLFIDCREKDEYDISHIKNAIWVGYNDFKLIRLKGISKSSELIVYCTIGYRSEIITKKLNDAGFTNVKSMIGGVLEWKNHGNKVYDSEHKETETVHTYDQSWSTYLKKGIRVW